jgi:hypothetical protein
VGADATIQHSNGGCWALGLAGPFTRGRAGLSRWVGAGRSRRLGVYIVELSKLCNPGRKSYNQPTTLSLEKRSMLLDLTLLAVSLWRRWSRITTGRRWEDSPAGAVQLMIWSGRGLVDKKL